MSVPRSMVHAACMFLLSAGSIRAASTEETLEMIVSAADRICGIASSSGRTQSTSVQGQVRAEINGLVRKLVDSGLSVSGASINNTYNNVLQHDLPSHLGRIAECKLQVFETLQNKLLATPTKPVDSPPPPRRPGTGAVRSHPSSNHSSNDTLIASANSIAFLGVRLKVRMEELNDRTLLFDTASYGIQKASKKGYIFLSDERPQVPIDLTVLSYNGVISELQVDIVDASTSYCDNSIPLRLAKNRALVTWGAAAEMDNSNAGDGTTRTSTYNLQNGVRLTIMAFSRSPIQQRYPCLISVSYTLI